MRLAPCDINLYIFFSETISWNMWLCGRVTYSGEREIKGSIPGNYRDSILLLWLFREPIIALSIKQAHMPSC